MSFSPEISGWVTTFTEEVAINAKDDFTASALRVRFRKAISQAHDVNGLLFAAPFQR